MNALTLLKKARELITDPKHWTQEAYARDANGRRTAAAYHDAVCFCSIGALYKIDNAPNIDNTNSPHFHVAYDALFAAMESNGIVSFNDSHSHEEVLAAFDRAIANLTLTEEETQV